jgi:uncharacterized membrane protein
MAIIEGSVEIKRPVDKVFAYASDVKSWPKWQTSVTDSELTSPEPMGIGATLRWKTHMMGVKVKFNGRVTDFQLNKRWSQDITTSSSITKNQWTFDSVEGGTKFTLRYDMKHYGFLKPFSSLFASSSRKRTKVALNNIKSILESQT